MGSNLSLVASKVNGALALWFCVLAFWCVLRERYSPPARVAAIQHRMEKVGVRRLQDWTVGMLEQRMPNSDRFLSVADIPDDIRGLTSNIIVCDDPVFHKGREHLVFVIRGGHIHDCVRVGRTGFVPYPPADSMTVLLAPGVWVEVEK